MAKSPTRSGGIRSMGGGGGFNPTSQVHGVGAAPPRGGAVKSAVVAGSQSNPTPAGKPSC